MITACEQEGVCEMVQSRIPFDEDIMAINILRLWDKGKIERFARYLLGDVIVSKTTDKSANKED